jgi:hypothetical protein
MGALLVVVRESGPRLDTSTRDETHEEDSREEPQRTSAVTPNLIGADAHKGRHGQRARPALAHDAAEDTERSGSQREGSMPIV